MLFSIFNAFLSGEHVPKIMPNLLREGGGFNGTSTHSESSTRRHMKTGMDNEQLNINQKSKEQKFSSLKLI